MAFGTVRVTQHPHLGGCTTEDLTMNLRENQLSSRSVIPVALALPINRALDTRVVEELERRRKAAAEQQRDERDQAVAFYL